MPIFSRRSNVLTSAGLPGTHDLLIGAGIGSIAGKVFVHLSERRRCEELPSNRVRQIEVAWISFGVTISFINRVAFG